MLYHRHTDNHHRHFLKYVLSMAKLVFIVIDCSVCFNMISMYMFCLGIDRRRRRVDKKKTLKKQKKKSCKTKQADLAKRCLKRKKCRSKQDRISKRCASQPVKRRKRCIRRQEKLFRKCLKNKEKRRKRCQAKREQLAKTCLKENRDSTDRPVNVIKVCFI